MEEQVKIPIYNEYGEIVKEVLEEEIDEYFYCEDCDRWFEEDDIVPLYDYSGRNIEKCVCAKCARENYYYCEDCERYFINNDEMIYVENHGDVCYSCRDNYSYCDDCGCYYDNDYVNYCEDDDMKEKYGDEFIMLDSSWFIEYEDTFEDVGDRTLIYDISTMELYTVEEDETFLWKENVRVYDENYEEIMLY